MLQSPRIQQHLIMHPLLYPPVNANTLDIKSLMFPLQLGRETGTSNWSHLVWSTAPWGGASQHINSLFLDGWDTTFSSYNPPPLTQLLATHSCLLPCTILAFIRFLYKLDNTHKKKSQKIKQEWKRWSLLCLVRELGNLSRELKEAARMEMTNWLTCEQRSWVRGAQPQ